MPVLTFEGLKAKQRRIRDGFPADLGLRVHRSLSWLARAEREEGDEDASFIFLWIAFNAAYAREILSVPQASARDASAEFFDRICALDGAGVVYKAIWQQFSGPIRVLLSNKYVFQPFWNFHNGVPGYEDWQTKFQHRQTVLNRALRRKDTSRILSVVFDRLHVLRNQIVHGGATWGSSINRDQVSDGNRILATLVPLFVDIMMDNPHEPWGRPYYPVVD